MTSRRVAYETARLRLSRYRLEGQEGRLRAAAHATQVSADALDVDRVGVWLFREHGRELVCLNQYDRNLRAHTQGDVLDLSPHPAYIAALLERRVLAVDEALTHGSTRELAASYLVPRQIGALLDASIIREGRILGVVRHEHAGGPRQWSQRDVDFASSVADMVTMIFDQADRLELEAALQDQAEQRQESQKMEALGRMACAVAHDFNNILGVVMMTADAVALPDAEPKELEELVDQIREMVESGKRLTHQLLTFGNERTDRGVEGCDLRAVLERMLPMLKTAVGQSIRLLLEASISSAHVPVDTSQVEQVLLNLVLNARDAITDSGTVRIVVRHALPVDEAPPDSIVLSVVDDGTGMADSTLSRVFEPFFTTKPTGTGLGLATVFGIVRRAGGVVRVASEPGRGTSVHVFFPRDAAAG